MKTSAAFLLFALSSPAFAADAAPEATRALTPLEAIEKAAGHADGFAGVFEMVVQSTSIVGNTVMLHSEADPRDPRCLSIALFPAALKEMLRQSGLDPALDLKGKKIRVRGIAEVVQRLVEAAAQEASTFETHYRQTQVSVFEAQRLVVIQ